MQSVSGPTTNPDFNALKFNTQLVIVKVNIFFANQMTVHYFNMTVNDKLMDVVINFPKVNQNLAGRGIQKILLRDNKTNFGQNLVSTKFGF